MDADSDPKHASEPDTDVDSEATSDESAEVTDDTQSEDQLETDQPEKDLPASDDEELDSEATEDVPIDNSEAAKIQRLEAVLLLARLPLASRKLSEMAQLEDGTEARSLVRKLNRGYDTAGAAFRAEEIGGGFILLTRQAVSPWVRRYAGEQESADSLSSPSLETLAVVAYQQPVTRAEIEAIRGVRCGEILRQLLEKDLIRISGRSEDLGRPYLYSTTRRFMQIFGLQSLEQLPNVETD